MDKHLNLDLNVYFMEHAHLAEECLDIYSFLIVKMPLGAFKKETVISQSPVVTSTGHTRNIEISTPKCNSYLHTVIGIWCHFGMETFPSHFAIPKFKRRKEELSIMSNISTSVKMNLSISWNLLIYISSRFIEITFPSVSSKMKKK